MARIVYSPNYNLGFYGVERLHPFDIRKYGRAWKVIRQRLGNVAREIRVRVDRQVSQEELSLVHTAEYLKSLSQAKVVAKAIEVQAIERLPSWLIDRYVLRPMRWATRGTILAATEALKHGLAVNLGGGFHHAKPSIGEGFSIYSDIGIAIRSLRSSGLIDEHSRCVYVDTDVHQGNGVSHVFMEDSTVFLFDMFNSHIYPLFDVAARRRVDCAVPIAESITNSEYMVALRGKLPGFLDSVGRKEIGIAIYNAGTDVLAGDPLGNLNISAVTIAERDLFVVGELRKRNIPTVMVLSGGYTKQSYQVVADSVIQLIQQGW